MPYGLPHLSQYEMMDIERTPDLIVDNWLSRISPAWEWTAFRCQGIDIGFGCVTIFFEAAHTALWNGVLQTFRTGTVRVRFNNHGEAYNVWWEGAHIDMKHAGILCRPLWLPVQFWDAIPEAIRVMDSDYADDPFEGAADFTPACKAIVKEGA